MTPSLKKVYDSSEDLRDTFPHINSYSALKKDLQDRRDRLFEVEEYLVDALTSDPEDRGLAKFERSVGIEAKRTLHLCKALSHCAWKNYGVTDEQHEHEGEKAQRLLADFKRVGRELKDTREQKEKKQEIKLLEFNAALFLAPLAAYGFLKIYFPEQENEVLCKTISVTVLSGEVIYVFRNQIRYVWGFGTNEIFKKRQVDSVLSFSDKEIITKKRWFLRKASRMPLKRISIRAGKKQPIRVISASKQKPNQTKDI